MSRTLSPQIFLASVQLVFVDVKIKTKVGCIFYSVLRHELNQFLREQAHLHKLYTTLSKNYVPRSSISK